MNKNAVSTLLSLAIVFVVFYMFKDQIKAVFSGTQAGATTKGTGVAGSFTQPTAVFVPPPGGELYGGFGVPGTAVDNGLVTIGPQGQIIVN